jgi:hypothetical protein
MREDASNEIRKVAWVPRLSEVRAKQLHQEHTKGPISKKWKGKAITGLSSDILENLSGW